MSLLAAILAVVPFQETPVFRAEVAVVRADVLVTRGGAPDRGPVVPRRAARR